jgi:hypothetical protein
MKNILTYSCIVAFGSLNATADADPIVLSPERANHAATWMNDGRVLITGGINEGATLDSALLYDGRREKPDHGEAVVRSLAVQQRLSTLGLRPDIRTSWQNRTDTSVGSLPTTKQIIWNPFRVWIIAIHEQV